MTREVDCTPSRDADSRDVHVGHMSSPGRPRPGIAKLGCERCTRINAVAERSCGRLGRLIVAFALRLLVSGSSVPQQWIAVTPLGWISAKSGEADASFAQSSHV